MLLRRLAAGSAEGSGSDDGTGDTYEDQQRFNHVNFTGLLLFGCVSAIALWRTGVILSQSAPGFSTKKAFHVAMTLNLLLESLFYFSCGDAQDVTKFGYGVHIWALFLALVAFSLVILYWSAALSVPTASSRRLAYMSLLGLVVFAHTVGVIVYLAQSESTEAFTDRHWNVYVSLVIGHATLLFLFTISLTWYGLRLQRKVRAHPGWAPMAFRHRVAVLTKLNAIMLICSACFTLRMLLLVTLVDKDTGVVPSYWAWNIFSAWIPQLVPALVLFYQLRRPDLGTGPQPPPQQRRAKDTEVVSRHSGGQGGYDESSYHALDEAPLDAAPPEGMPDLSGLDSLES